MPPRVQSSAFYDLLPQGTYRSNQHTVGPWSPTLQHGGPPAALLGHCLEAIEAPTGSRISRIAFDFLGPVPVETLSVTSSVLRPGQRVLLTTASLRAGDRDVMRATAWHVRAEAGRSPAIPDEFQVPARPSSETRSELAGIGTFPYAEALEWRFTVGDLSQLGPATVWTRCRIPVIAGRPITGLQRLLVMVDAANGVSAVLPITRWTFVPVELTVALKRHPRGQWVGMSATTSLGDDGIGLTHAILFDDEGTVGHALQTLYVAPR